MVLSTLRVNRVPVALMSVLASVACSEAGRSAREPAREYDLDPQLVFWERLQELCGDAYTGEIVESVPPDESFGDRPVMMHVRECDVAEVRIDFVVGEDRTRTWVITPTAVGLRLTHRHVHADGTEDEISRYGGETLGPGSATTQDFHADAYTARLVPEAESNVWSVEIFPDSLFAYGLRRDASDRRFRVEFDLSRRLDEPRRP